MDRQSAQKLLEEFVESQSLRNHCLSVALSMQAYANKLNEDEDLWYVTGLLHDFDYEIHPTVEEHPIKGVAILREKGYPEDVLDAIMGHGNHTGVPRISMLAKCLFAVDELSGFVVALARVRPGNFDGMTTKSIKKALKKKGFAAGCNRDDIRQGIEELQEEPDVVYQLVIDALSPHAAQLLN